jgi:hypothetical protein
MQLSGPGRRGSILAAALALPGLAATLPEPVRAETQPDVREFGVRWSHYQDFQPGADRMQVIVPALFVLAPFGDGWAIEGLYTYDTVSGASPVFHDTLSGASGTGIHDKRRAGDVEVTRYFERASVSVGAAISSENDYESAAVRVVANFDSDDRNWTWTAGAGYSDDTIDSTNDVADDEARDTLDLVAGVSHVFTPSDIAQLTLTWVNGDGYFDDPYKPLDTRPDARDQRTAAVRWNHFVPRFDAALRLAYRYYDDSWDITAHTFDVAWEQPLWNNWTLTPSVRYTDQSAAEFYVDPPFGAGFVPGEPYSGDTRLSAFGAWSAGVEVTAQLPAEWRADFKFLFYRQRDDWRWFGDGSPDIEPLSARVFELGVRREF